MKTKRIVLSLVIIISLILITLSLSFSTASPDPCRWWRNSKAEVYNYPTTNDTSVGRYVSGSITNLTADDAVYWVWDNVSISGDAQVDMNLSGTSVGHIPFLQLCFQCKTNVSVNNLTIVTYDYWNSIWASSGTMQRKSITTSTSDTTYYIYQLVNGTQYRSTLGDWKIRIIVRGANVPFRLSIDYCYYRTVGYELLTTGQTSTAVSSDIDVTGQTLYTNPYYINITSAGGYEYEFNETSATNNAICGATVPDSANGLIQGNSTVSNLGSINCTMIRITTGGLVANTLTTTSLTGGGLPFVFITEDTNDWLLSSTWAQNYFVKYFAIVDETYCSFGISTQNSTLWQYYHGSAPTGKTWHWIASFDTILITRGWNVIFQFTTTLITRIWNPVTSFITTLATMGWKEIATLVTNIITRSWLEIALFSTTLSLVATKTAVLTFVLVVMIGFALLFIIIWRRR